jgi:fatty-acyl-CoA synthase
MTKPLTIPATLASREDSSHGITFLGESDGDLVETLRWSYGELIEVTRRSIGALRELGVRPGDRVGLLGSTTPDLVAAVYACWCSGAIAVPLAVPLRLTSVEALADEVASRARRADISLLAVDDGVRPLIPLDAIDAPIVNMSELRDGPDTPLADVDPDSPALIQFTSGSTAKPKGVTLSHRALILNGLAAQDQVRMTPNDVVVSWLPLYHDFGLIGFTLWPVIVDMPTHLMAPETFIASPKRWLQAMSKYHCTITAAPNFAYGLAARALRSSLKDEGIDLSALRCAANGAEPVDIATMEQFIEAAAEADTGFHPSALVGVYGLAECTLGVAAPRIGEPPPPWWVDGHKLADEGIVEEVEPGTEGGRPLVSVGYGIPTVEVAVFTPAGDRLPDGVVGEIWVKTPHAMLGYWNDPEESARVLVDGWVRAGDLGVMGPDGLYITGRLKDMIIVGGRNLYPEDAERAANSIPGVRKGNAVAFGIVSKARAKTREGLVVIAETRLDGEEAARLAKQIATEVRKALRVAADQVVLLVPGSLPKTPSGKLQRNLTRKLYEAGQLVSQAVATAGRALGGPAGAPEPA